MTKRAIGPSPRSAVEHGRAGFDAAIKENLELIMGHRGTPVKNLAASTLVGSTAELVAIIAQLNLIIAKQNEVIALLQ